jgi:hypothetical protein
MKESNGLQMVKKKEGLPKVLQAASRITRGFIGEKGRDGTGRRFVFV